MHPQCGVYAVRDKERSLSQDVAPVAWLMSPISIAIGLGFSDQSQFTRVFRNTVGLIPGAYARQPASE